MNVRVEDIKKALRRKADKEKAAFFPRFFKAGRGEYAEGDIFIGVTVPDIRSIVKKYNGLPLSDTLTLLKDPIHEVRLTGVLLLVQRFQKGDASEKKKVFDAYIKNVKYINNWDLVDASAPYIVGAYLFDKKRSLLHKLAASNHLWKQRIAMISTMYFIRKGDLKDALRIAEKLLSHEHDLIHKASGWMLREIGKKDEKLLVQFLEKHGQKMPRTMLRYAIEKFPEEKRLQYLKNSTLSKAAKQKVR